MTLSTPLLAAVPLVASLLGPALSGAAPEQYATATRVPDTPARPDVAEHDPAQDAGVLSYWTPERMAKALPLGLPVVFAKGGLLSSLAPPVTGDDPVPPREATRAGVSHRSARPLATTTGSRWAVGGAVTKTTGRVFLTLNGVDFVCSASTVRSRNRDLVVTAGHCVKDGTGAWARNWTFVPGYRKDGSQPYGRWTARRMFVAGPWARAADDNHDIAMVALSPSRGRHVADVVGVQDIAFGSPRGGRTISFGYPADPPYDGRHLVYCSGALRDDPYGGTQDQGLGCDMTAGASGGPWLSRFDTATGKGTITSLSSFKYSDDQRTMYGPLLGESAKKLYELAGRA